MRKWLNIYSICLLGFLKFGDAQNHPSHGFTMLAWKQPCCLGKSSMSSEESKFLQNNYPSYPWGFFKFDDWIPAFWMAHQRLSSGHPESLWHAMTSGVYVCGMNLYIQYPKLIILWFFYILDLYIIEQNIYPEFGQVWIRLWRRTLTRHILCFKVGRGTDWEETNRRLTRSTKTCASMGYPRNSILFVPKPMCFHLQILLSVSSHDVWLSPLEQSAGGPVTFQYPGERHNPKTETVSPVWEVRLPNIEGNRNHSGM